MIDPQARLALQNMQRLRTVANRNAVHPSAMSHLQIEHRIPIISARLGGHRNARGSRESSEDQACLPFHPRNA